MTPTSRELYDADFYTWTQTTASLLRRGKWSDLDARHLATVLKRLGDKRAQCLRSWLVILISNLFKWCCDPTARQQGYAGETLKRARQAIADLLAENPGLRPGMEPVLGKAYAAAVRMLQRAYGLPQATFPPTCPWTLAQMLSDAFWPEIPDESAPLPDGRG